MAQRKKQAGGGSRKIVSVEFKPEQHAAVMAAAEVEGHQIGPFIRSAALREARRMGFWAPEKSPGPKKIDDDDS